MGSAEQDSLSDEWPAHEVRLDDFSLGETEVTVLQYYLYCTQTGHEMPDLPPWGEWTGDNPIPKVSWQDAKGYCDWLSGKTGRPIRLPTEAEWEYAARRGETGALSSGDPDAVAWFEGNSNKHTQPARSKWPNALGFYGMQGNAREWCSDWYQRGYYASSPADDPQGPERGAQRVLRGGSWADTAGNIRITNRDQNLPYVRSGENGFRVAEGGG